LHAEHELVPGPDRRADYLPEGRHKNDKIGHGD